MAFINKIFSIKKKNQKNNQQSGWNGFNFSDQQQVRIILFRDCEWQNRKLLFDSAAIKKVTPGDGLQTNCSNGSLNKTNNERSRKISFGSSNEELNCPRKNRNDETTQPIQSKIEVSNGVCYQFSRPNGDINNLGEMIFGSVALTFRGTCLKIHSLRASDGSSKNIMCSHVFYPPIRPLQRTSVTSTTKDSTSSHSDGSRSRDCEGDSGIIIGGTSDQSIGSSVSSLGPSTFHSIDLHNFDHYLQSSNNSLNRRALRNLSTSLDYWPSNSYHNNPVGGSASSYTSGSYSDVVQSNPTFDCSRRNSTTTEDSFSSSSNHSKRIKLGLAILIELTETQENELEQYLLEHMPILDSILWRLRDCVQRAYWRKSAFIPIMIDGSKEAASSIRALFGVHQTILIPSLYTDIYNDLSLSGSWSGSDEFKNQRSPDQNKISDPFWKILFRSDFTQKRNESDVEKFIRDFCELLAILDNKSTNFFLSALITAVLSQHLGWTISVSNNRNTAVSTPPCSALWTQLCEMCGAIGYPPKYSQTVVAGKDSNVISALLQILSYFIRFSSITRKYERRVDNENEEELFNETLQRLHQVNKKPLIKTTIETPKIVINDDENVFEMKSFNIGYNLYASSDLHQGVDALLSVESKIDSEKRTSTLKRTKTRSSFTNKMTETSSSKQEPIEKDVVFVLGDNDRLVGLKSVNESSKEFQVNTSFSSDNIPEQVSPEHKFKRSQSVPPIPSSSSTNDTSKCPPRSPCHQRLKKYSGVKFNFEQYPQIATNFMKSKNIEIATIPFLEKGMKMSEIAMDFEGFKTNNFPKNQSECQCGFSDCSDNDVMLQTPSNASELESTSDLPQTEHQHAQVQIHPPETIVTNFERKKLESTIVINDKPDDDVYSSKNNYSSNKNFKYNRRKVLEKHENHPLEENESLDQRKEDKIKMNFISLPLCRSMDTSSAYSLPPPGYRFSLIRLGEVNKQYMPGVIIQGVTESISEWGCALQRDLALTVRHSPVDQSISEAVCILADMDNWNIQLVSSSSLSISGLTGLPQIQNSSLVGIPIASSQLVGDMLESLQELWKARVAAQHCLQHIENRLREIYIKSFAFSEMLLATDFCDMTMLTNALELHSNDVPLLLAVASTHSPQVTQKYNVTFQ